MLLRCAMSERVPSMPLLSRYLVSEMSVPGNATALTEQDVNSHCGTFPKNKSPPTVGRPVGPNTRRLRNYFAQDLIGDALVWVNQAWMLDAILVKRRERLCETTIFCTKGVAELFRCRA